jgi:hypothetical protein
MKTVVIWLSYDLGVGGDYQNLYAWLDSHEATECGPNLAYIKIQIPDNVKTDENLVTFLQAEILSTVEIKPGNRIYAIRESLDIDNSKSRGSFIFGKRKASLWTGFSTEKDDHIDQ